MVTGQLIGGLGNQLFISAAIISYSLKHNMGYCIPRKVHQPHYPTTKDHSYNFPNIKYCDAELNLPIYTEPHYHYSEIPYYPHIPDICLNGYFQSWRYFHEYREEILKAFDISYVLGRWISLHVRRGDYLDYPNHHPTITLEYIYSAIEYFNGLGYSKFLIFSDDTDWCLDNIKMPFGCVSVVSDGKTELEDMALMSSCEHNICSNSSFSWWGAYLNQNPDKKIVMPSVWFGSELTHNTKDLYLPEAIII